MTTDPLRAALLDGRLANPDAVLHVRESAVAPSGMRAIDVLPMGGIAIRVLPDRGMDLGQAWFSGVPLAWVSEVGEVEPIANLVDVAWGNGFGGGLLTTCGLRNVGLPSEGHGLHGTFSHLSASDVTVERDLDRGVVTVKGIVVDDREVPELRVERSISTFAGRGRLEVVDVTTNLGDRDAEAPLLYHCNFGYPLWTDGAALELGDVETTARDDASRPALPSHLSPPTVTEGDEWVLEHRLTSGEGRAIVTNRDLGVSVELSWDGGSLPMLNQWIDRNPGMAVLGLEPANCTTRGRAYERAHGGLPIIAAGEHRRTAITIEARPT